MITNRAWVLLPSGRRLDLLNPDPQAWTDHDLSVGHCQVYVLGTRNGCIRYTDLPGFRPLLPA